MNDPHDPFSAPLSTPSPAGQQPGALPSLAGGGNSLAQSARLKQLNTARGIMFAVGVLTILLNIFQYTMVDKMVDEQLNKEANDLRRQGFMIDQVKLAEIKESAGRTVRLVAIGLIAIGIMYIVFGFIVKTYPVPVTIVALVIYVGCIVIFGVLDPATLAQGIIFKVIVVVALAKAVQAAIAYQSALKESADVRAGFAG
jgi:hypothetical protein